MSDPWSLGAKFEHDYETKVMFDAIHLFETSDLEPRHITIILAKMLVTLLAANCKPGHEQMLMDSTIHLIKVTLETAFANERKIRHEQHKSQS